MSGKTVFLGTCATIAAGVVVSNTLGSIFCMGFFGYVF